MTKKKLANFSEKHKRSEATTLGNIGHRRKSASNAANRRRYAFSSRQRAKEEPVLLHAVFRVTSSALLNPTNAYVPPMKRYREYPMQKKVSMRNPPWATWKTSASLNITKKAYVGCNIVHRLVLNGFIVTTVYHSRSPDNLT